jgi:hypothetical protein
VSQEELSTREIENMTERERERREERRESRDSRKKKRGGTNLRRDSFVPQTPARREEGSAIEMPLLDDEQVVGFRFFWSLGSGQLGVLLQNQTLPLTGLLLWVQCLRNKILEVGACVFPGTKKKREEK